MFNIFKRKKENRAYKFIKEQRHEYQISKDEIETIENNLNIKIPEDLKNFYLEYNGSEIHLCVFDLNGSEYEVNSLVPLKYSNLPFEKIVEMDRKDGFIPDTFIPLAYDRGGDYYYLDLDSEKVLLVRADNIENPYYICENLEALFKIMEEHSMEN